MKASTISLFKHQKEMSVQGLASPQLMVTAAAGPLCCWDAVALHSMAGEGWKGYFTLTVQNLISPNVLILQEHYKGLVSGGRGEN